MSGRGAAIRAQLDQLTAKLRDLVQLARDHRDAHECAIDVPCPGEWAAEQVADLCGHDRARLLLIALAELAALGYGLPAGADAYEVTEQAEQALRETGDGG